MKMREIWATDCGEFDGEMGKEDLFCAFPLFFWCWNFVGLQLPLVKVRNRVYNDPGYTATKVDNLKWVLVG